MKKISIIGFALLSTFFSCCKSPTGPDGFKDPRTYTWTIDTLAYPGSFQTNMRSIWGSSASDVYVVGHNDQAGGLMWHYNGEKWEDIKLAQMQGGNIGGSIDLTSVFGFSPNDVWAVGMKYIESPELGYSVDSSLIIHYDGTSWREISLPGRGRMLQSVGGASPTDVWAGGTNVLYHYDGVSAKHYPIFIPPQGIQIPYIAAISTSEVYMTGYRNDVTQPIDSSFYYLYRYNGTNWSIIDSTLQGTDQYRFGPALFTIDQKLYAGGGGVWQWTGNGWNRLFDESWIYNVGGSNRNNIFACGGMASLYHYDGSDWRKINLPVSDEVAFYDIWTDGREAFIVGHDGNRTFIAHGK